MKLRALSLILTSAVLINGKAAAYVTDAYNAEKQVNLLATSSSVANNHRSTNIAGRNESSALPLVRRGPELCPAVFPVPGPVSFFFIPSSLISSPSRILPTPPSLRSYVPSFRSNVRRAAAPARSRTARPPARRQRSSGAPASRPASHPASPARTRRRRAMPAAARAASTANLQQQRASDLQGQLRHLCLQPYNKHVWGAAELCCQRLRRNVRQQRHRDV